MSWQLKYVVANGARVSWEVPHAVERARERDVPQFIAERIIRQLSEVADAEPNPKTYAARWAIFGHDTEERPIHVIVEIKREDVIVVITVIRKDE